MKPELLLLAKMYAEVYCMSYKTYETSVAIYSQMNNMNEETTQLFLEQSVIECEATSQQILVALLGNLMKEFPACFSQGETIEQLMKKISPSFPGKPLSPYKEDLN